MLSLMCWSGVVVGAACMQLDFARFVMASYRLCDLTRHELVSQFVHIFLDKDDADHYRYTYMHSSMMGTGIGDQVIGGKRATPSLHGDKHPSPRRSDYPIDHDAC